MKITVINGTEKHGVTYHLKEIFLESFRQQGADITEFYLPKDCPAFCIGCFNCLFKTEEDCKDARAVSAIDKSLLEADLIVMASPTYVFHVTGAMKSMLDHFAYRWMLHRPAKEMFGKRAVIITQCIGSGSRSAARDLKDSLSWWGISKICVFSKKLKSRIFWDKIPEKRRAELTKKIKKISSEYAAIDYSKPARPGISAKAKFYICRMIQKKMIKSGRTSIDSSYWSEKGWLGAVRPW